jgi:hypothetical protein
MPMTQKPRELFNPASYVLSRDNYDEQCTIRDKLLLMAQLAATTTSNGDHDTILFICRSLIRQLFGDLSFQIDDVLEDVAKAATCIDHAKAH